MAFGFFKKKEQETTPGEHYYTLTVKEIVKETPDTITIVFDQPEPRINYKAGQFLSLILNIEGKEVRRSYSLCSSPYVDEDLAVTVKRVEDGLVSNHLNDLAISGDKIKIQEPMGNFTTEFSIDKKRHIIMFGGGSGITPLMSIIKSTIYVEPDSIVTLIYANRNIDSIIFKDQLDKLQNDYEGRFRVIYILDDAPINWQGHSGLLNHEMLNKLFERLPNWGLDKTVYLMCGPEGMMNNVQTLLDQLNIPPDKIFKESFVAGIIGKDDKKEDTEEIQTQDVTVVYDGEEYNFTVKPDSTILDTALDQDIDLPFSCQSGLCTACRGKLISGKVKMDEEEGLSESEMEQGYVLLCVGHPLTDDVKIEIG